MLTSAWLLGIFWMFIGQPLFPFLVWVMSFLCIAEVLILHANVASTRLQWIVYLCIDITASCTRAIYERPRLTFIALFFRHQIGQWNCVATCFFVDTASNIVQYVEHIHSLLVDGGIWINLGPLLYHYTDSPDVDSTELSYAEFRNVILHYGFDLKEESQRTCHYTQNSDSMMHTIYYCPFFVAIKKPSLPQFPVR